MSYTSFGRAAAFATACIFSITLASAQDLNSFRAAHGRPVLSSSAQLSGIAQMHASSMASRSHLDHNGFMERAKSSSGTSAENVSYGCETEACAIKQWANSGGHRANMLRSDVDSYGIASATSANGRKYWVLELAGSTPRVIYVRGGKRIKATKTVPFAGASIGRDLGIER
ncbi:MAG TPA: CAP domain-containing protein [Pseudolabrys sp.]|nr:CAP domain-containing protein [Pseudolabrys sp.]